MYLLRIRLIAVLTALALTSLACQLLSSGKVTPTVEKPTVSPTATGIAQASPLAKASPTAGTPEAQPEAPPALELPALPPPQPGPAALDLAALPRQVAYPDLTEAYQVNMSWTDPDDAPQQSSSTYSYRKQTVPSAGWRLLFVDDNPFFPSNIETVQLDQTVYSVSTDTGCQVLTPDRLPTDDQRQAFISLLEALTGQVTLAESEVMVGQMATDVYLLQSSNLKPDAEIVLKAYVADSDGEFSSTVSTTFHLVEEGTTLESGKLYLARQGGHVAKIELAYSKIAGDEDAPLAKPGTMMQRTLVYEATLAASADVPIAPPATCEGAPALVTPVSGSAPVTMADIPRMSDASIVVEDSESLVYQTNASVQEVADFYRTEMANLGWTLSDDMTVGPIVTLEFTSGAQTLSISIMLTGSTVTVTIDLS